MKNILIFIIFIITLISCTSNRTKPKIIVTSPPLAMILQEITGEPIESILPTGASPHTYSPKPSGVLKVSKSKIFFYIAKNNDGWAEKMDCPNKIEVIRLLPKKYLVSKSDYNIEDDHHEHSSYIQDKTFDYDYYDSHFWTDPMTVKAILPYLLKELSKIDSKNIELYRANAEKFSAQLDELDKEVFELVRNIHDKPIFLFHPSFLYLIRHYGLTYGGSIEWNPGQENTPNGLAILINRIKTSGVKAIFSEPQLPEKSAVVLAEQSGTDLFKLNPLGTDKPKPSYKEFILFNINVLKKALE